MASKTPLVTGSDGFPQELQAGDSIPGSAIASGAFENPLTFSTGLTRSTDTITVATAGVSSAMLRNSAALSVIGRTANSSGVPADIAAANDGEVLRRNGTAIGFGTIATAGIADNAVTLAKLATQANDTLLGNVSGGSAVPSALTALQAAKLIIPIGLISHCAGSSTPSGWLFCDGSAVSRTTYAALFSAISTTYGAGNGTTTFNLPDIRGRTVIGTGTGSGLTARSLAGTGGGESVALSTAELPSHNHNVLLNGALVYHLGTSGAGANRLDAAGAVTGGGGASFYNTTGTGSGTAHNNMQPFIAFHAIIFAGA